MTRDPREIAQRIFEIVDNEWWKTGVVAKIESILAAEMPRWVPVEERLPEGREQVLGYFRPVDYPRTNYSLIWQWRGEWWGMFSDFEGNIKSGEIPEGQVTHWQPLPSPPRVK